MSTPWIAYGQTTVPFNTASDNPVTNDNGVVGAVLLPYLVPVGKELVITSFGIEAYGNVNGCMVLVPWIGALPATNAKCLHSVLSNDMSNESVGAQYHLPAGSLINVRIMCSENPGSACGWYVNGHLEDV